MNILNVSGKRLLAYATLIFLMAAPALGQGNNTRWVTDELSITMRSGPGNDYRIIRSVKSGTRVEVLEVDQANGFSRVTMGNNREGWVVSRYLAAEPGSKEQLAEAQSRIVELTDDSQPLQQKLAGLQQANNELEQRVTRLAEKNSGLEKELKHLKNISADAINIDQNNQKLVSRNQVLQNDIDILRAENERLSDKSDMEWFLNGVFAVAFGVFLTLVVPRLRPRKRHSEWT